jgi:hypothetical protein
MTVREVRARSTVFQDQPLRRRTTKARLSGPEPLDTFRRDRAGIIVGLLAIEPKWSLKEASTDRTGILVGYYRSLAAARAILRVHPELAHIVQPFVEKRVSIPEHLRPLLAAVVTVDGARIAEPPRPQTLDPKQPTGAELGSVEIESEEIPGRIQSGDRSVLALSDQCLRRLVQDDLREIMNPAPEGAAKRDRAWYAASLELVARALSIHSNPTDMTNDVRRFFAETLPRSFQSDPDILEPIVRICRLSHTSPTLIPVRHRVRLDLFKPFVEARARVDRELLGAGEPLERRAYRTPGPIDRRLWQTYRPPRLDLSDEAIEGLICRGAFDLETWLATWRTPRVFLLAARLLELCGPEEFRLLRPGLERCLQTPLSGSFVTRESIPWIVRLAEAYAALDQGSSRAGAIRVKLDGRSKPIPLERHPAYREARLGSKGSIARVVDKAFGVLDPSASGPDLERRRLEALQALLSGREPVLELAHLIDPLIQRSSTGRIFRMTGSREVLAALGAWNHVAVLSVLAGLLTEASEEQILGLLREKGHDEPLARRWSGVAIALRGSKPGRIAHLLRDISGSADRADLTTIPLRLRLEKRADLGAIREAALVDGARGEAIGRALVERAMEAPHASLERDQTLAAIDRALAEDLLSPNEIRAAVEATDALEPKKPSRWPLAPDLIDPLFEAIDRSGKSHQIEAAFDRLWRFVDPELACRLVLERAHRRDMERVAPLGSANGTSPEVIIRAAIAHLERRAGQDEGSDARDWLALALSRADPQEFSEDAVVGLAKAAEDGTISADFFARVQGALPRSMVENAMLRVRSAKVRAALKGRSPQMSRIRAPAEATDVAWPSVGRGYRAPR